LSMCKVSSSKVSINSKASQQIYKASNGYNNIFLTCHENRILPFTTNVCKNTPQKLLFTKKPKTKAMLK